MFYALLEKSIFAPVKMQLTSTLLLLVSLLLYPRSTSFYVSLIGIHKR